VPSQLVEQSGSSDPEAAPVEMLDRAAVQ
jgi:hypothetical protein